MSLTEQLNASLEAIQKAHTDPIPGEEALRKGYTQDTGLTAYDLENGAKIMYPLITPLLNETPRVGGAGDTATKWKAITGININKTRAGVSEGNRGAVIADEVKNFMASYVGLGLENTVTFESEYAAGVGTANQFDLPKARAVEALLRSLLIQEEIMLLGGNQTLKLGTTPTPVGAAGTGGSIADATYKLGCVALTYQAMRDSSLSTGVIQTISKLNADGTTDTLAGGAAKKSALATVTVSGGSGAATILGTVDPVLGATGYAWFVGTAGNEKLVAITTINSVKIDALPDSGNQAFSALGTTDLSYDADFNFDGLLTYAFNPDSNATINMLATGNAGVGTALSTDGKAGVQQISDMLVRMWDKYRLGPDELWMGVHCSQKVNEIVLGGGGAPLVRFNLDANQPNPNLVAGAVVGFYLNPANQKLIPIRTHPDFPRGTILANTKQLPYAVQNVGQLYRMKLRKEHYQLEWPLKSRKYEFGTYMDGLLQHYAPFAMGLVANINDN